MSNDEAETGRYRIGDRVPWKPEPRKVYPKWADDAKDRRKGPHRKSGV